MHRTPYEDLRPHEVPGQKRSRRESDMGVRESWKQQRRERGAYVWAHYRKIPGSSEQKMEIKTIDENYPHKKSMMKQTNSCHTTLQNELTCLKEAFQDHINEVKLKIIKQKWTKDNRKKRKTETRKEITRHLN